MVLLFTEQWLAGERDGHAGGGGLQVGVVADLGRVHAEYIAAGLWLINTVDVVPMALLTVELWAKGDLIQYFIGPNFPTGRVQGTTRYVSKNEYETTC